MKKRLLSFVCAAAVLLTLLPCFTALPLAAEEDPYAPVTVPLFDCDTPFGSWVPDTENAPDGGTCLTKVMGNGSADSIVFAPVNGALGDTLEFELYLSSLEYFDIPWGDSHLEITSSGTCDYEEMNWNPKDIENGCVGGAKVGWNHVVLLMRDAGKVARPDPIDLTRINFIRFFFVNPPAPVDITVKIDNFVLTNRDAKTRDELENVRTPGEIPLLPCNEPFSGWTVDREYEIGGSACLSRTVGTGFTGGTSFAPVDAEDMDTLSFWIWVSDPSFFTLPYRGASLEISSSGTCDVNELAWSLPEIGRHCIGGVKTGWNLVLLPLSEGYRTGGDIDLHAVNFLRLYCYEPAQPVEQTVKIDHFAFVRFAENGLIPALDAEEMTRTDHSVPLYGCNLPFGEFTVDYGAARAGSAAISMTLKKSSVAQIVLPAPVNASGMDTLEFEFYVSDPALFGLYGQKGMNSGLELSSAGQCDKAEVSWNLVQMRDFNRGDPIKAGWNHIVLYLDEAAAYDGGAGKFNVGAVNFIRVFAVNEASDPGIVVKFDNFRLTDVHIGAERANRAAADEVISMIDGIGEITYRNLNSKKTMVTQIRAAYERLSGEAKVLVTEDSLTILRAAEDEIFWLTENPETEPSETEPETVPPETEPENVPPETEPAADGPAAKGYPVSQKTALISAVLVSFVISAAAYMTVVGKRAKAAD